MKDLAVIGAIGVYVPLAYLLGRLVLAKQLGWVYARRYGLRSRRRLLIHLWLFLTVVATVPAYLLVNYLGSQPSPELQWVAVWLLAVILPLPIVLGVGKAVDKHIAEGYANWQVGVISRFTT